MIKYNIAAKTGSYTDGAGNVKNRWKRVGVMIDKGNGPFLLLDTTFNPAGMPHQQDGKVLLSLFEPKDIQGTDENITVVGGRGEDDNSDDIPF